MDMFRRTEISVFELEQCLLHRVEGIFLAGKDGILRDIVTSFSDVTGTGGVKVTNLTLCKEPRNRHPVLGEGAGLIDTKHGRRTQGFDSRDLPGEDISLGNPPCSESEEDGQHDRELFGEDSHGERDAGQKSLQPVEPGQAVHDDDDSAQGYPDKGDRPDDPVDLHLQPRLAPFDCLENGADLPHFCPDPGCQDLHQPLP